MSKEPYVMNLNGNWRVRKVEPTEGQPQAEKRIESRLKDLGTLVGAMVEAPYPSLLAEGDSLGDVIEDLVVKEARVRWLVRVAKYSQGANRRALWEEAEKALAELEKTAGVVLHAECA